ncbi:TLC domain-containing protein 3A-like [Branchiostoma floridae x Branchiostoma japonicum]
MYEEPKMCYHILAGCVFFPGTFYLLLAGVGKMWPGLSKADLYLLCNSAVSSLQAIISCCVGCVVVVNCYREILYARHWLTEAYTCFGVSYFYYDIWSMYVVECARYPEQTTNGWLPLKFYLKRKGLMVFHHLALPAIFFPIIMFFRKGLGDFFVASLFFIELSTPFVAMRAILLRFQMENSFVYILNGVFAIVAFFICRIAIFPILYAVYGDKYGLSTLQVPFAIPLKCNIGCAVILGFQIYWFAQMVRLLRSYSSPKQNGKHQPPLEKEL